MAKKPKEPDGKSSKSNGNPHLASRSGSSDIFKTLFGDVQEQQGSTSIFSDHNPFRRRPSDVSETPHQQQQPQEEGLGLGLGSAENVENAANEDDENPNFVELKKRKRNKEKKSTSDRNLIDEIPETSSGIKKSKKRRLESSNSDVEYTERGEEKHSDSKEVNNRNMGMDLKGTVTLEAENQKKKTKRKRDELEAQYEARHYGVVTSTGEGGEAAQGGKVVGQKRKKIDDPADMMVSKEGFDDEAKLLRTVFVGNLPLKIKKKALLKEFGQFGEVESVRIRSVPLLDTKKPRKGAIMQKKINDAVDSVHAYIVFKTEQAVLASLAHNMAVVGGNHIRVDRACPPRKKLKGDNAPLYDNKRTIFVGNLPFDVKDEEIYQLFCGIKDLESSIEAIRVIRDPGTSVGKGIAYILFKTRGAANLVVKKRSLKLRDRELRLCHARSDLTPSKRKTVFPGENNESPNKKLAVDSRTPDCQSKVKIKAASSYQGLRANKSGAKKKVYSKAVEPKKLQPRSQSGETPKERKRKRPAVAARKAKALKGGRGRIY
ncbi:hypothetical protein NMG60_11027569 [Bertholletia excelsa]